MLDKLQHRRLGPLHIIDQEHERTLTSDGLEQQADRPERLLGRGVATGDAEHMADLSCDPPGPIVLTEERGDATASLVGVLDPRETDDLPDPLDDRQERDAIPVREAA